MHREFSSFPVCVEISLSHLHRRSAAWVLVVLAQLGKTGNPLGACKRCERRKESLTVGKDMVTGRITSGITRKNIFMVCMFGLDTPDSAPSCAKER